MDRKLLIFRNLRIIYAFIFVCFASSCQNFKNKEYNNSINTIKNIKYKNSYGKITLTIEKYFDREKEIIASFIYEEKKASVKLKFEIEEGKLKFISTGKESDYFLYSISELFEEKLFNQKMKDFILLSISRKGDNSKIDLFNKESEYRLFYKPNSNEKGSLDIRMTLDMELGKISIWEKNGGIAKKNFVKVFEENK